MILKYYEVNKVNISNFKYFIIYGENEGLKKEVIEKIRNNNEGKNINYEETQILKDKSNFFSEIKNKSLFDEKRIFLVERCTDKISEIVLEIYEEDSDDILIFSCGILEKKSKIRKDLEKSKYVAVIPTYKDNSQSLINIAKNFFTEKVSVSYETLNLLVNRCSGDRGYLRMELEKFRITYQTKKLFL